MKEVKIRGGFNKECLDRGRWKVCYRGPSVGVMSVVVGKVSDR